MLVLTVMTSALALAQATFTFTSFDPPGAAFTQAWAINDQGTVVGDYADSAGVYAGYQRFSSGTFSQPITRAGENVYTDGINNSGVVSGYYSVGPGQAYPPPNPITTFTLSKGIYRSFSIGPLTQINAINKSGDFTGVFEENSSLYPGFLHISSTNTTQRFSVPGAAVTFAYGLNNTGVVVGVYRTPVSSTTGQAFIRNASGGILTFGFPGAASTGATNINDCGTVVGAFQETSDGAYHGFYGRLNSFTQIDYPGASATIVTGMNNHGDIVGHYEDTSGTVHGFVATPAVSSCSP